MSTTAEGKLQAFETYLYHHEKAVTTIKKYICVVEQLLVFLAGREIVKSLILEYRDQLLEKRKAQTVNGSISAINAFLDFDGLPECKVKLLKVQRQAFI